MAVSGIGPRASAASADELAAAVAHAVRELLGRTWRVSAGVFWQVHPAAASVLTEVVLAAMDPRPGDVALDLYCGAGLFTGALAAAVGPGGRVTGVESDVAAVRDARKNLAGFPQVRVHRDDAAQLLARRGLGGARLAVLDPPRTGADRGLSELLAASSAPSSWPPPGASLLRRGSADRLLRLGASRATLARDLAVFAGRGWRIDDLRAFDAFPMTHHVECVATLAPRQLPGHQRSRWMTSSSGTRGAGRKVSPV